MKLRSVGALGLLALGVQAGGAAAAAPQAAVIFHHPRVAAAGHVTSGWASSNWSGYAKAGTYSSATAAWTVPSVSATKRASFSSSWVGIDGFNNSSLIQTGTEQDYYSGSAHYDAWWEILPAAETIIPSITVHPGDSFTANIHQISGSSWSISITDVTTNTNFTTTQTYTGPGTSIEWIQEAPTVGGRVATLAHYGTVTFDPGTANGGSPGLTSADSGVMIQGGAQVSTPSNPDSDSDGFTAKYGSSVPSPPAS